MTISYRFSLLSSSLMAGLAILMIFGGLWLTGIIPVMLQPSLSTPPSLLSTTASQIAGLLSMIAAVLLIWMSGLSCRK